MDIPGITNHYIANRSKYVKRMRYRCGNPAGAEDIVQSAYELAIMYRAGFNPTQNYDAWFNTILNNSLRKYQNEERGYVGRDEEDEEATEDVSCPHLPSRAMEEIYERIEAKSPIQKHVLMMHFKQGYTAVDISKISDYSFNVIRQIIWRFRQEIKELYKEH